MTAFCLEIEALSTEKPFLTANLRENAPALPTKEQLVHWTSPSTRKEAVLSPPRNTTTFCEKSPLRFHLEARRGSLEAPKKNGCGVTTASRVRDGRSPNTVSTETILLKTGIHEEIYSQARRG